LRTITAHGEDADIGKLTNGIAIGLFRRRPRARDQERRRDLLAGLRRRHEGRRADDRPYRARVNGQQVFRAANENVGRTDQESLHRRDQLQAKRAVLAALQASDVSGYVGRF
jgi:hypothetical protein